MALSLPNPLPDNPLRWDGWKLYNSPNYYDRLCLSFDSNASNQQIEENCRQLLVWWQKKLPLKNQPSNPLSQILRAGLDEAPIFLVEARTYLLDPEVRRQHDLTLRAAAVDAAGDEFKKLIGFTITDKALRPGDEERLIAAGISLGLSRDEAVAVVESELTRTGSVRVQPEPEKPPEPPPAPSVAARGDTVAGDPFSEFRRILQMSRLCLEGEDMTDDQRDAMCNLGESLGLTGGQSEDVIDEYLEQVAAMPTAPLKPAAAPRAARPPTTAPSPATQRPNIVASPKPAHPAAPIPARKEFPVSTPLVRAQEREKYPNFTNLIGADLFLVASGVFAMGSRASDAQPNEQPVTTVAVSCYFMARHPVTNAQYERFDPSHAAKRAPWANDRHPVIHVTALEAERFCEWLSRLESRRYRLPTEAEWEYAARGLDGRSYPWGDNLDAGHYANFADACCTLPWRDPRIDDGWAQSSPVGAYPKGASPFGIEDLAGNVFEWCLDYFEPYKGRDIQNPRSTRKTDRRIYRGGGWKSRASSLRATARAFNNPSYASNDVGFRIVCECA
ncbi:MAG: SUMF1/EgtB/PvdO family nonheme iron enzyme [Chthoniobacteraceae bacterium]